MLQEAKRTIPVVEKTNFTQLEDKMVDEGQLVYANKLVI